MGEGTGHESVPGADSVNDRDPRSLDGCRRRRRTGHGPVLAMCHEDEWDARCVPDRDHLILRQARVQPGQILLAHLQDVDQPRPALEAVHICHTIRDQPGPDIGIQTDDPAAGLAADRTSRVEATGSSMSAIDPT